MPKKPAERQPRVICDDCAGMGCTWSDASLAAWEDQTPWFNRDTMSPKPPESWRDRNCTRCQGAGYLDLKTGRPLLERLIDSAQRADARRRRMEMEASGERGSDLPATAGAGRTGRKSRKRPIS